MDLASAADATDNIITSAGIFVGGIWAYFKFIRGRSFLHGAELGVTASLEQGGKFWYLFITITVRNSGLSKLILNEKMKAVRLFVVSDENGDKSGVPTWNTLGAIPILGQHKWIEEKETVTDTVIYKIASDKGSSYPGGIYRVEAIIGTPLRKMTGKGIRWRTSTFVFSPPVNEPTNYLWAKVLKQRQPIPDDLQHQQEGA